MKLKHAAKKVAAQALVLAPAKARWPTHHRLDLDLVARVTRLTWLLRKHRLQVPQGRKLACNQLSSRRSTSPTSNSHDRNSLRLRPDQIIFVLLQIRFTLDLVTIIPTRFARTFLSLQSTSVSYTLLIRHSSLETASDFGPALFAHRFVPHFFRWPYYCGIPVLLKWRYGHGAATYSFRERGAQCFRLLQFHSNSPTV